MWLIAQVAERFHVLPSVVARDLDEDSERLGITCTTLLAYGEAWAAFKAASDEKALEPWKRSKLMKSVIENEFLLHRERVKKRNASGS